MEDKGEAGEVTLAFDLSGPDLDEAIAAVGEMPLPPYIAGKRGIDAQDRADYQTVYAAKEGAVAAPTAGLHFTPQSDEVACKKLEYRQEFVTLHVGAGTFLPVKAEDTEDHRMHAEWGEVSAATCERLKAARARPAAGSWPWARPRCGLLESSGLEPSSAERPTSSSRPATGSGRWTC